MAAGMAAANATAMAVTATASNSCVEGICIVDATAGAITASMMAVKVAAR